MRHGAGRTASRIGALAPVAAALALALPAADARAQRPAFAPGTESLVHDGEQGYVRVHYVTTSADAVPGDDADGGGTPDFVEEVARLAEIAWDDLVARGFRMPLADTDLVVGDDGGDARFDIYLRNLGAADGNYVAEACTDDPIHCAGFFSMENDLAGFGYSSLSEGISVLTSHELFHAVQAAYTPDTPLAWSEGTAVWNEELTFPEQDDYERFVRSFLTRSFRPFERPGAGFGDPYPYGAALWPTFLDERYGDGIVRRTWEALDGGVDGDFLDAIDQVLGEDGESLDSAWTEFSRWNLFTGPRADPDRSYAGGADLGEVAIEEELEAAGVFMTSIEGMSARYVPIAATAGDDEELQLAVQVDEDGAVAAFFPQAGPGEPIGDAIELTRDGNGAALTASFPDERRGILVVTGLRRGGLPRDTSVELGPVDDDEGGCQAARSGSGRVPGSVSLLLAAAALYIARRRPFPHHHRRGLP